MDKLDFLAISTVILSIVCGILFAVFCGGREPYKDRLRQEIYDYMKEHKECPFEIKDSVEIINKLNKK